MFAGLTNSSVFLKIFALKDRRGVMEIMIVRINQMKPSAVSFEMD